MSSRRCDDALSRILEGSMPIERAEDHPTFTLGGNAITSLAAPARGSDEVALYRVELPPDSGLPAHTHDHFDVFTVMSGEAIMHLDDEAAPIGAGDSVVVPPGVLHRLETGAAGASIVVTMLAHTKLFRHDDGSVMAPPWVS
jgi:quercetin dioxygenase-like cupin family protein